MLTTSWKPSTIKEEIYAMLVSVTEYSDSYYEYTEEAMIAVESLLAGKDVQWNVIYDDYPDCTGWFVSFCWIEDNKLQHVVFNARKEEV